jgi:DegV family protein with EDD domain
VTLTTLNTAIVLDSTADFPEAPTRFANVREVPLYVRFGDETLRDHMDITPAQFYERLATAPALPTTSQPTPHDFLAAYRDLVEAGFERIYSIHVSAKVSGTFRSASVAAAELGGDRVVLVDTASASVASALLALAIERRLERGATTGELDELVERYVREAGLVFTVGTLEYLQRGGRIGRAQALAGTLLNVRPILSVRDGVVVPIGRVRGRQKALEEFARMFLAATRDDPGLRVAIAHANAPDWVHVLTDLVQKARPRATIELVETLGAVVGTHAGPGTAGLFWFQDDQSSG